MHVSFCHQNKPIKGVCCKEQLAHHSPFQSPRFLRVSVSLRDSPVSASSARMTGVYHIRNLTWCWGSNLGPHAGPTPATFYKALSVLPASWRSMYFTKVSMTDGSTWGSPSASSLLSFFRLEPRPAHVSQKKALDITHPLLIPQCPIQALTATQSPWLPCLSLRRGSIDPPPIPNTQWENKNQELEG